MSGRKELRADGPGSFTSFADLWVTVRRNGRLFLGIVAVLLTVCVVYCLIAPNEYEASGEVELRGAPESLLAPDRGESASAAAFAMGQVQLETLANVLRSEQLAWRVITDLRLYDDPAFARGFRRRFPEFSADAAGADAKEYLLRRFDQRLTVESLPHTVVLGIRFRSRDAGLSARVVNQLIEEYEKQETDSLLHSARGRTEWLNAQLQAMKVRVDQDTVRLAEFQQANGIVSVSGKAADAVQGEVGQSGLMTAIEEGNRALVNATADRIARGAEYRAAKAADPEAAIGGLERSGGAGNTQMRLL